MPGEHNILICPAGKPDLATSEAKRREERGAVPETLITQQLEVWTALHTSVAVIYVCIHVC